MAAMKFGRPARFSRVFRPLLRRRAPPHVIGVGARAPAIFETSQRSIFPYIGDFARTVEIHRKPGYDPVELILDPGISSPKLTIGRRLIMRKLGFRALMDVIPLDASLVKGSHGRVTDDSCDGPIIISDQENLVDRNLRATDVKKLLLDAIFT